MAIYNPSIDINKVELLSEFCNDKGISIYDLADVIIPAVNVNNMISIQKEEINMDSGSELILDEYWDTRINDLFKQNLDVSELDGSYGNSKYYLDKDVFKNSKVISKLIMNVFKGQGKSKYDAWITCVALLKLWNGMFIKNDKVELN